MSESAHWLRICREAQARPLNQRFGALYVSHGITIALFCACALASGFMLFSWNRLTKEQKKITWRLYGWYSSLGCAVGILGAATKSLGINYETNVILWTLSQNMSERYLLQAEVSLWASVIIVPDSLEVLFMNLALLVVLDRLVHVAFATSGGLNARRLRTERAVAGLVIALDVLAICFSCASAYYFHTGIPLLKQAAAAALADDTKSIQSYMREHDHLEVLAKNFQALQLFAETAALIFLVATFTLVSFVCFRRMRKIKRTAISQSASRQMVKLIELAAKEQPEMRDMDTLVDGRSTSAVTDALNNRVSVHTAEIVDNMETVHRQIFLTVAVVVLSLWCMSICLTFYGASTFHVSRHSAETIPCDPSSRTSFLIEDWLTLTPEFFILCVYMPGPIAVLAALCGMTSKLMLQMLKNKKPDAVQSV